MAFDAGSAHGKYILDISDAERKIKELQSLFAGLARQSSGVGNNPAGARQTAQANQAAERAILTRANAEARLAQVQNTGKSTLAGLTQAEKVYADALAKVDRTSVAAIRTQTQLAAVQNRIASQAGGGLPVLPRTLESFGTQALDQVKSGLLGVVGPAALVTAGFTAMGRAAQAVKEGFNLKAQLDQVNASLTVQLRGVRDSAGVFADAARFGEQYKLTQQEINQALIASTGILRTSRAGADELLGVLARLQILSPEQGLEGAALALKELSSGQTTSLVTRFEVSRTKANELKREIENGADAVQVMARYLDDAGVSMDALKARTEGAAGAQNNLARAQERFSLALGNIAASNGGVAAVNALATATQSYAILLNGEGIAGLQKYGLELGNVEVRERAYAEAKRQGKDDAEAAAIAEDAVREATRLAAEQMGIAIPITEGFRSSLRGITADAGNAAAALEGVRAASGFKGSAGSRSSDPSRGDRLQSVRDAEQLELARRDQILATGTLAQRIAIRQQEYADAVKRYGKDSAEAVRAQTALIREQQAAGRGVQTGLSQQLRTQEGIYDSLAKQRDALLDIEELTIRDRQQDREDAAKRRTAEAILRNPNASADLKARAADALALIDVQDRKRAAELANKQATAGGAIINGKLFQSVPGGGAAGGATPLPTVGGGTGAPAAGGAGGITLRLVDSAGRVLAETIGPIIMDELLTAARSVALERGL